MCVQPIALFLAPLPSDSILLVTFLKTNHGSKSSRTQRSWCGFVQLYSCSLQKQILCLGYTVLPASTAIASRVHWHLFLPTLQGTGHFSSWAVEHRCGISCNREKSSCLQSQRSREHRSGRRCEIEKGPGKNMG